MMESLYAKVGSISEVEHGGKASITARVTPVRYGMEAICTIISDDGKRDTVDNLFSLAEESNIKITIAQVIGFIDCIDILKEYEDKGHLEFINHSWSHLRMEDEAIPKSVLQHELLDAKLFMEENFCTPQIAFVPPNNQLSKAAYNVLNGCYYAIRRWKRLLNDLSPLHGNEFMQWLNLGCKGIKDVDSTQERNQWVDDSIAQNKWLIEMWHDVNKEEFLNHSYQELVIHEAKEHIAHIVKRQQEGKLWIASFTEAVRYIYERQTASISVERVSNELWKLSLTKGITEKDNRFDMPLTVRIDIRERCDIANIHYDDGRMEKIQVSEDGVALVELLPGHSAMLKIGNKDSHKQLD